MNRDQRRTVDPSDSPESLTQKRPDRRLQPARHRRDVFGPLGVPIIITTEVENEGSFQSYATTSKERRRRGDSKWCGGDEGTDEAPKVRPGFWRADPGRPGFYK